MTSALIIAVPVIHCVLGCPVKAMRHAVDALITILVVVSAMKE
jgi:hypothetical protein